MNRCSECEFDARFARATGPTPARILFLGEKPGRQEAYRGFVFVGDTGEELNNTYFPLAGIERGEVRMSNCVRCWLGGTNNKPSPKQIDACARNWTPREIEKTEPEIIVLLGATACSLIPAIEIEKDHGLPFLFDSEAEGLEHYFGKFCGWIWPMYHPAAALHDTGMMRFLLEDFENFGRWLQGKWQPPKTDGLPLDYRVLESNLEFDRAWEGIVYDALPIDTEDDCGEPWSLQFSPAPGQGYLVFARSKLVQRFARYLEDLQGGLLLHFAMHDQNVLESMGVNVRKITVHDTMQEAYQLCNLPQGLKSMAWRRLGVRMRSWEDTVLPYSREKMLEWLMQAWDEAAGERERVETAYKRPYRGKLSKVEWKRTHEEKKAKWILDHSKNPEYDIWEKSEEAGLLEKFQPVLGVAPRVSIVNVPIDIAVHYACQDADLTGRMETVLAAERELRASGVWKVREEDWDQ